MLDVDEISKAWIRFHNLPEQDPNRHEVFWSVNRLDELVRSDPELAWQVIGRIRNIDSSDLIIANVAAGPMEDLLVAHGYKFIERVENIALCDESFRRLLSGMWKNDMSDDLWARVAKAADTATNQIR